MNSFFKFWAASLLDQSHKIENGGSRTHSMPDWGKSKVVALDLGLILVFAICTLMLQLGNTHFWEQDEGFYAATALEMYERGDWVVPTFNQELFAHKPPLMFWGIQLGYWIWGVGETGARFFSAVAAVITCLLTYWMASKLFDRLVGLIAAMSLASNLMFCVVARSATADAYLSLWVFASLAAWFVAYKEQSQSVGDINEAQSKLNGVASTIDTLRSIGSRWWIASYICMGGAVLAKGPIGFLFPITILAAAFWFQCLFEKKISQSKKSLTNGRSNHMQTWMLSLAKSLSPWHILRILHALRLHWGIGIVLLVAAPWFLLVDWYSNGAFLAEFIGVHHLGRFSNAMDNHSGPAYYYIFACLIGFYPWSGFAIPTLLCWGNRLVRQLRTANDATPFLWLTLWVAVYIVVFSLAKTKLPNYVLPIYPVLAIAVAVYLKDVVVRPGRWVLWQRIAYAFFLLVGLAIITGPFILSGVPSLEGRFTEFLQSHSFGEALLWSLILAGVPLMLLGLVGFSVNCGMRNLQPVGQDGQEPITTKSLVQPVVICVVALLFVTHLSYALAPKVDRLQSPQLLVERTRALAAANSDVSNNAPSLRPSLNVAPLPLTVISMFRPTLVYYAGGRVEFAGREDFIELAHANLAKGEARYWLVQQEDWEQYQSSLPASYIVIDSALNFPKPGRLYIVGDQNLVVQRPNSQ